MAVINKRTNEKFRKVTDLPEDQGLHFLPLNQNFLDLPEINIIIIITNVLIFLLAATFSQRASFIQNPSEVR